MTVCSGRNITSSISADDLLQDLYAREGRFQANAFFQTSAG